MNEQMNKAIMALFSAAVIVAISVTGCTLDRAGEGGLFGPGCPEGCVDAGTEGSGDAGTDACPEGCTDGTGGSAGSAGTGGDGGSAGSGGDGGAGGESCVPTVPATEVCDGVDNDCDPSTEDGSADPEKDQGCDTGLMGICQGGTKTCNNAAMECVPDNAPKAEVCSSTFDEDCDGHTSCYDSDCSTDTLNCRYTVVSDGTEVTVMVVSNDAPVEASPTDGACGPMADVIGNPGSDGKILIWKPGTSPTTELEFAAGAAPAVKYRCSTTFAANACPGTPPTNALLITEYQANYPMGYQTAPYSINGTTVTVTMTGLCSGGPYELIAEIP